MGKNIEFIFVKRKTKGVVNGFGERRRAAKDMEELLVLKSEIKQMLKDINRNLKSTHDVEEVVSLVQ